MKVELRVQRYDPEEQACHTCTYPVDVESGATVLDALIHIAEEQDPTLAFRRVCVSGICGSCGLAVNGRPVLGCQARLDVLATGDGGVASIAVGPLPHFPLLRDLVVDMEPFFEGLKRALPWLVLDPAYDGRMPPQAYQRMESPATCVLCGLCAADEPVAGQAAGPAAWVKAYRYALDPRDRLRGTRLHLLAELGLLGKEAVARLAEICPKRILIDAAASDVDFPGRE